MTSLLRKFAVLAVLVLMPLAARAADVVTVDAPEGVEVWLSEEHTIPMIAVSISLPAGSAYDPADLPGVASMMSSLLNEGAGDLDDNAFKEALETYAIRLGFSTGSDYMGVTLSTLTENADEAFRLLALALQQPRFDAGPIERVRAQTLAGLRQDEEDPSTISAKAWAQAYFGDHPYAHDASGTFESVAEIGAEDIRAFAMNHLVRGGAKVAVAGDITPGQLGIYLEQVFGPLPLGNVAPVAAPAAPGTPGTEIIEMEIPQPAVIFGLEGPMRSDPDFIPTYVANYILGGGGFSSRLMDEVRENRGLTYGISTGLQDLRSASLIRGSVQSERTRVTTALEVTKAEMARFANEGVTETELADAKTYLTGSFPLGLDSNSKIAGALNGFQRAGLGPEYVAERNGLIEAVTLEKVNEVARRFYNPDALVIVIAGTPAPPEESQTTPATEAPAAP
jgi:zinc protease